MSPDDVTIEVLDGNLTRQGQILRQYWTDVKAKTSLRAPGEWSLSLPATLDMAQELSKPGAGILITGPAGQLFAGPVDNPTEKADQSDPDGTITFSGPDYLCVFADALAYPDPEQADPAQQGQASDVRTGSAETVIRALASANIGPSAPAARRGRLAQMLTLEPDFGRGITVTSSTRFDPLLDSMSTLGKLAALGFRIEASTGQLLLRFFEPVDRSKDIRLDIANGRLTSYEYDRSAPSITRAIVGGQGEGAARTFIERTNQAALAAEVAWGRRIERFQDQRNTDDPAELQQAGDEALAGGGATTDSLTLTPTDDDTMRYQVDWALGDLVSAVTSRGEIAQIVTAVAFGLDKDGVRLGAIVGTPDSDDLRALQLRRRVTRLETRT